MSSKQLLYKIILLNYLISELFFVPTCGIVKRGKPDVYFQILKQFEYKNEYQNSLSGCMSSPQLFPPNTQLCLVTSYYTLNKENEDGSPAYSEELVIVDPGIEGFNNHDCVLDRIDIQKGSGEDSRCQTVAPTIKGVNVCLTMKVNKFKKNDVYNGEIWLKVRYKSFDYRDIFIVSVNLTNPIKVNLE